MNGFRHLQEPGELASPQGSGARSLGGYRATNYWQEQHWRLDLPRMLMQGYYRTFYGSFKGEIVLSKNGDHQYFVFDPPHELQRHTHWPCFVYRGNGKYWVHFSVRAENVDAGIITIEKILREAKEL